MKKAISLFLFASLITSAAPNRPTFALDCTPSCTADVDFIFSGDNYSPRKQYLIYGTAPGVSNVYQSAVITPDTDGHILVFDHVSDPGTWTFTIYVVNHNASPTKDLASIEDVDFAP